MLLSVEALRAVLVDLWGVLPQRDWVALTIHRQTVPSILDRLANTTRFRRVGGVLPFLTPYLREAIISQRFTDPVVEWGGHRWLKLEGLSTGSQGAVAVACPCVPSRDPGVLVALKEPKTPAAAPALRSEIDALIQVGSCEHIAALVAYDRPGGRLATQLVNGPNLEELCQQQVRLPYAQVVRIGLDVCTALAAVHSAGLIHKDLKPANIVLDGDGKAILIDFGLAEDPRRAERRVGGTPYYIAPEVLLARTPPDRRADIFSLSATLYRLLAGQPPHFHQYIPPGRANSSAPAPDLRHFLYVDGTFDSDLEDLRHDVPRSLARLIRDGLSTDRTRRPTDTDAFRQELEQVQAQFNRVAEIELQLRKLSEVLLEAFRQVRVDDTLAGQVWVNAEAVAGRMERVAVNFPAVFGLQGDDAVWMDYGPALVILPQTLKIPLRVGTAGRQLRELLNAYHTPADRVLGSPATALLTDLLVRTLEEIRRISFDALAVAHDWRTVLIQYGLV